MSQRKEISGLTFDDVWNFENGFHWFSHKSRLNKFLAHYELYKSIVNLPGDVLELGVYKGASLIRLATFRDLLENDFSRKIIGFDAFGNFPRENIYLKEDNQFIEDFERSGGSGISKKELEWVLSAKGFDNLELFKGNVFRTLPNFIKENPAIRISLLHLDMDVKEPTEFALELLFERIVPGGLLVLDDYGSVLGETEALDAFITSHALEIEKLSNYSAPAFVRKPLC